MHWPAARAFTCFKLCIFLSTMLRGVRVVGAALTASGICVAGLTAGSARPLAVFSKTYNCDSSSVVNDSCFSNRRTASPCHEGMVLAHSMICSSTLMMIPSIEPLLVVLPAKSLFYSAIPGTRFANGW